MADEQVHDPLNFMRNLWGNVGFSLPGMVAPTFDLEELDKRIKDLKAGKGICLSAGVYTDESRKFTEGRPVDLYDKERLNRILNAVDTGSALKM